MRQPSEASELLTGHGIDALRAGDRERAYTLLTQAIQLDAENERAWLWLSGAVESDRERWKCLERVLSINPDNRSAKDGLQKLNARANDLSSSNAERPSDASDLSAIQVTREPVPTHLSDTPTHTPTYLTSRSGHASTPSTPLSTRLARGSPHPRSSSRIEYETPGTSNQTDGVVLEATVHPLFWRPGIHQLIITHRHVTMRSGLIGKAERSIPMKNIQDVSIHYDMKGRMLGYGTIRIESAGRGETEIVAEHIKDPENVKNTIMSLL